MALNIIVVTEKLVEIHHGYTQRKNSVNINPCSSSDQSVYIFKASTTLSLDLYPPALLEPQMYKFQQTYKTFLKCIKINRNCINHPQMYKNWPHMHKQGTDKCINKIDHNWLKLALSQPQIYKKKRPQMYK